MEIMEDLCVSHNYTQRDLLLLRLGQQGLGFTTKLGELQWRESSY
jgi:hypothetical protein